jgi:Cd(II)/Pb(II)-responsive transcriptional regulator
MRIGEVAEKTQTPIDTIRYYEREGLLPAPSRTAANYRTYQGVHVDRLNFIRRCRQLDMSLEEIRALLAFCDRPASRCDLVNTILDEHIQHVEVRMSELRRLAKELRDLRAVCRAPGSADDCEILIQLRKENGSTRGAARPRARASHG